MDHIHRILDFCRVAGEELGADMDILLMAATIHGIKDKSELAGALGEEFDRVVGVAEYRGGSPSTLEERILWDANLLDSLGYLGLARAFTRGGHEGQDLKETVGIIRRGMERPLLTGPGRRRGTRLTREMEGFLDELEARMGLSVGR